MQRTVVVALKEGLHARPAALFAQAAAAQPVPVTIRSDASAESRDAGSILSVMALGVGAGAKVVLTTPGESADDVSTLDALEAFLVQSTIS